MKLYGTTTSPFVRRVRVVAAEVGEPIERIDTATDAGQAALREVSPIRKVPVAIVDGRTLYDSRAIIDWLTTTRGWRRARAAARSLARAQSLNAIDAALDSVIQLFYLRRDGVAIDGTPYAERQLDARRRDLRVARDAAPPMARLRRRLRAGRARADQRARLDGLSQDVSDRDNAIADRAHHVARTRHARRDTSACVASRAIARLAGLGYFA